MPSATQITVAMRAVGWGRCFRQTEVTEPMDAIGDLAGRISRCGGFWSRPVFGGWRRARCARSVSPMFAGIYIDAIDEPNRGKHGFFQDILSARGLRPGEVCRGGGNPDSEIEGLHRLHDAPPVSKKTLAR